MHEDFLHQSHSFVLPVRRSLAKMMAKEASRITRKLNAGSLTHEVRIPPNDYAVGFSIVERPEFNLDWPEHFQHSDVVEQELQEGVRCINFEEVFEREPLATAVSAKRRRKRNQFPVLTESEKIFMVIKDPTRKPTPGPDVKVILSQNSALHTAKSAAQTQQHARQRQTSPPPAKQLGLTKEKKKNGKVANAAPAQKPAPAPPAAKAGKKK
mgnify:CR=1 FL=1